MTAKTRRETIGILSVVFVTLFAVTMLGAYGYLTITEVLTR